MSQITLEVKPRNKEEKVKDLRKQGTVPCVLYGYEVENLQIECDEQEFHKTFVKAGESTMIDLDLDGKKTSVLIHKVDLDPVTDRYSHIDFFAPDMKKEIITHVAINTTGEAPGVKDFGGILITHRDSIEVKCLPKDLPHEIVVDLSQLKELHDSISVADLDIPNGVSVQIGEDNLLFVIDAPRKEEVIEKPEEVEGEGEGEGAGEAKEGEETGEAKEGEAKKE
jgi:large subunit ribosomal protein L25